MTAGACPVHVTAGACPVHVTAGACPVFIGNQTAFSAPPLVPFEYALAHGFDAFEFFPDEKPAGQGWRSSDWSRSERTALRAKALDHAVRLSVHASLGADPSRREGVDAIARDLDFAHDLGAQVLVIHGAPSDVEAFAEGIVSIARGCRGAGIDIAIENTIAMAPEDFSPLFAQIARRGLTEAARVGVCLDIGHANLHPRTRNQYLTYLDRLSPELPILHLHAHENRGDADSHLTLFTGPAGKDSSGIEGLVRRLRQRAFSGSVILEQWPNPPSLLVTARDRLRAMLIRAAR